VRSGPPPPDLTGTDPPPESLAFAKRSSGHDYTYGFITLAAETWGGDKVEVESMCCGRQVQAQRTVQFQVGV
jgi:hypothetical protein